VILYEARTVRISEVDNRAWLEKVSRGNKEWVDMVTNRGDRFWVAELSAGERKGERFIVLPKDAWNFNIEIDLPVLIGLTGARPKGTCRIVKRLKNNKKYIKI